MCEACHCRIVLQEPNSRKQSECSTMENSVVIRTGERLLSGELAQCGECTDGEKGRMQRSTHVHPEFGNTTIKVIPSACDSVCTHVSTEKTAESSTPARKHRSRGRAGGKWGKKAGARERKTSGKKRVRAVIPSM